MCGNIAAKIETEEILEKRRENWRQCKAEGLINQLLNTRENIMQLTEKGLSSPKLEKERAATAAAIEEFALLTALHLNLKKRYS